VVDHVGERWINSLLSARERKTAFWAATAAAERDGRGNGAMSERWVAPDDGEEGEMGR
jgi:hypothetical protein